MIRIESPLYKKDSGAVNPDAQKCENAEIPDDSQNMSTIYLHKYLYRGQQRLCLPLYRTGYSLIYEPGTHGQIRGKSRQTVQSGMDGETVRVSPDEGYRFARWDDGDARDIRTDTDVQNDIHVTALWVPETYVLTYTDDGHGTISGRAEQYVKFKHDGETVTALANSGYAFLQWSDGATENPRTDLNVTADIAVEAQFETAFYDLVYSAEDGGSVSGDLDQHVQHGNDGTVVEAIPEDGYTFSQWSDGATENPRTDLNVTADIAVEAMFISGGQYTITYAAYSNGTISGNTNQTVDAGGDGSRVIPVPDDGYHFLQWDDGSKRNPRRDMNVQQDIDVTAYFDRNIYTLQYVAELGGNVSGATYQGVYHGEDGVAATASANPGYQFDSWFDGVETETRHETNVTESATYLAEFIPVALKECVYVALGEKAILWDLNTNDYHANTTGVMDQAEISAVIASAGLRETTCQHDDFSEPLATKAFPYQKMFWQMYDDAEYSVHTNNLVGLRHTNFGGDDLNDYTFFLGWDGDYPIWDESEFTAYQSGNNCGLILESDSETDYEECLSGGADEAVCFDSHSDALNSGMWPETGNPKKSVTVYSPVTSFLGELRPGYEYGYFGNWVSYSYHPWDGVWEHDTTQGQELYSYLGIYHSLMTSAMYVCPIDDNIEYYRLCNAAEYGNECINFAWNGFRFSNKTLVQIMFNCYAPIGVNEETGEGEYSAPRVTRSHCACSHYPWEIGEETAKNPIEQPRNDAFSNAIYDLVEEMHYSRGYGDQGIPWRDIVWSVNYESGSCIDGYDEKAYWHEIIDPKLDVRIYQF